MKKAIACILSFFMCFSCFLIISFAEETTSEHLTEVPEGYVGIYTKDDLYEVRSNPAGKFVLMNNIIFEESDFVKGGGFYNSGKGWEPIGTSSTPFTGVIDGNYYVIKNLYTNTTSDYAGLFGYVQNATIIRINMQNANIKGANNVGGIVGYIQQGRLNRCSFDGIVEGENNVGAIMGQAYSISGSEVSCCDSYGTVRGVSCVGGILGYHNTSSEPSYKGVYKLKNCINTASVYGNSNVGGIIGCCISSRKFSSTVSGYIGISTEIANCANTGDITCADNYVGGILGTADTKSYPAYHTIDNCYNVGSVSGNSYVGGILGFAISTTYYLVNISVAHSYSIGNISSESNFGGCFGKSPTSISYCYYLDESVTNPTSLTGTPKSSDQLVRKGTFEQWDFDSVWTMEGREDYEYPELRDMELVLPGEYPYHEHSYVKSVSTPATHLSEGIMTYTCECGDSYTEIIAKTTEHNHNAVVTAPTCTEQGFTTYTCECGDTYTADFIEASGHNYNKDVTAPTCTEKGCTTYTCGCGYTYVGDYVDAKGHEYTATATTSATHLTEGIMTYTCACGDSYTEAIAKTPEHTYSTDVIAPTCTEQGFTVYTCECGDSYKGDLVGTTEHEDSDGDGYCDFCDEELEAEDGGNTNKCSHMCHKSGFIGIIWKIINFFCRLFGINPVCECGKAHY